jgi:uncharacterized membrane protein
MGLFTSIVLAIGSVICHQRPERSFFWDGHQLPVCARCTGIYLSAAVGFVGWLAYKGSRRWRPIPLSPAAAVRVTMVAAVPTAVSVASSALGAWDGSNLTRALLGVPIGATAGAIVAAVAAKDLR